MKKVFISLITFLLLGTLITAQDLSTPMTVRLKSGDSISGTVAKNDDGSITVTTIENDTFYFSASEIKSIEIDPDILRARKLKEEQEKKQAEEFAKEQKKQAKELARQEKKQGRKDKRDYRQTSGKGYMTIFETGLGVNHLYQKAIADKYFSIYQDYLGYQMPAFHWINGYSFSPHFFLGAGVGLNVELSGENMDVPFYLHLRSAFSKTKVAPYIAISGGGAISYLDGEVGPYADATVGIRMGKKKKRGCWLGVGASYARPGIPSSQFYQQTSYVKQVDRSYNLSYSLKFSVSF